MNVSPIVTSIQLRMGHWWEDPWLLHEALTHSSWGNECGTHHNERLEYLGDSVLDLATAEWLMARFPHSDEGFMSQRRASLVCAGSLARMSRRLEIDRALLIINDEQRREESVLADAFEAVVGALYQDSGSLRTVRNALLRCGFFDNLD